MKKTVHVIFRFGTIEISEELFWWVFLFTLPFLITPIYSTVQSQCVSITWLYNIYRER